MAGEFTAGLSGGQRKLLLFELIRQRIENQSELLICLDEPFAGVTDDFVPFIVERLNEMRKNHNILLVTNDHVDTLTKMADNTITVSAIDRTKVKINDNAAVDREQTILALAVGDKYQYDANSADLKFFLEVEVLKNHSLMGIWAFTAFSFLLFLATFWDSAEEYAALIVVAASIVAFFCINPYLLALTDWRNAMIEEAEALVHASEGMNKFLKTCLALFICLIISLIEWGCIIGVTDSFRDAVLWIGILFDSASMTFPFICLGVYTKLPFQAVEILGSMPFLLMIFFSTTFSPGSGVPVLKELRYLFSRFYLWCELPGVQNDVEGCPEENNTLYLVLSAFVGVFVFLVVEGILYCKASSDDSKEEKKRAKIMELEEFQQLQIDLYGKKALRKLQHMNSSSSLHKMDKTVKSNSDQDEEVASGADAV